MLYPHMEAIAPSRSRKRAAKRTTLLLAAAFAIPFFAFAAENPPPEIPPRAPEVPAPVSQGQFAAQLGAFLQQATDEESYRVVQDSLKAPAASPQEVAQAVEYLAAEGLVPYRGWQPSEPLRRHDVTSLVVRACRAEGRLDLSDPGACLAFAESQGCDPSTVLKAIRFIWNRKMNPDPASPAPDR